jgi:hypothetical protein
MTISGKFAAKNIGGTPFGSRSKPTRSSGQAGLPLTNLANSRTAPLVFGELLLIVRQKSDINFGGSDSKSGP